MIKTICKKEYNTDTANVIKKYTYSYYGDPTGYEETLYQTQEGLYFLYVNGGEASLHPTEDIKRIGKEKANIWLAEH